MTTEKAIGVEETLRKIVAKIIRKEDVVLDPNTSFKDLGADSLDIVQIMVAIEEAYDIELVDEELKAVTSLGGFIDYIKKKVAEKK